MRQQLLRSVASVRRDAGPTLTISLRITEGEHFKSRVDLEHVPATRRTREMVPIWAEPLEA